MTCKTVNSQQFQFKFNVTFDCILSWIMHFELIALIYILICVHVESIIPENKCYTETLVDEIL